MNNTNKRLSELDKEIGTILNFLLGKYIYLIIIGMIVIVIIVILFSYYEYKNAIKESRKEILKSELKTLKIKENYELLII